MSEVLLKGLKKVYDGGVTAVHDVNLHIKDKEFIVLVGPSGCGKSTTLRMVAGLEDISGGELYIDGKLMNNVAPKDRDIAMVFQSYALYPHMTVRQNMGFALKLKKVPKAEIKKKVEEVAQILDVTRYLDRKPKALSGGQRQRVATGRAMVRNPNVFLMDEPLSNLDAKLRNQMRAEIIMLRKRIDTTFMYVTHDQTEALTLGDRIVIMKDGYVNQIGTPRAGAGSVPLYRRNQDARARQCLCAELHADAGGRHGVCRQVEGVVPFASEGGYAPWCSAPALYVLSVRREYPFRFSENTPSHSYSETAA